MTDIVASKLNVQIEATRTDSAVSESLMQSMGSAINYLNTKYYFTAAFDFTIYSSNVFPKPNTLLNPGGPVHVFEYDAVVFNAWAYAITSATGAGGTILYNATYYPQSTEVSATSSPIFQVGNAPLLTPGSMTTTGPAYVGIGNNSQPAWNSPIRFCQLYNSSASAATFDVSAGGSIVPQFVSSTPASSIVSYGLHLHYLITGT